MVGSQLMRPRTTNSRSSNTHHLEKRAINTQSYWRSWKWFVQGQKMEGRQRNIQNYMTIVKCILYIRTKYTSVTLLKLKTFKIWTINKKYINVNFAYKFYFIISNCSNRKNQLITPLWIKKLTKRKRRNKINSRHMRDRQLLLEARHQQVKQQHERVYGTQSQTTVGNTALRWFALL